MEPFRQLDAVAAPMRVSNVDTDQIIPARFCWRKRGDGWGHLVFHEPRYRLLFAGDMVSTITSIVIAPPEGDLAVYLQSLRRLGELDCRLLLPALHPEGTVLQEIRSAPAALGRAGVRIDYSAREPDQPARNRAAVCGFAGSTLTPGRLDLVAVTLDGVPLGEVRLLYLKRFWLEAFGATAQQPGIVEPLPAVPEIGQNLAYSAQQLVNALASCLRLWRMRSI